MALTAQQHAFLSKIPHQALALFKDSKGCQNSWFNIGFRLQVALHLAEGYYTSEASEGMHEAFSAIKTIRRAFHASGEKVWAITPEEIELIEMGLEAADTMQREVLRRDLLAASHLAKTFMKAFADEPNPDLHT